MDNRTGYTSALFITKARMQNIRKNERYNLTAARRLLRLGMTIVLKLFKAKSKHQTS